MKLVSFGPVGAEQPGLLRDEETIVPLGPLLAAHRAAAPDMNAVLGLLPALAGRPRARVENGPATVPVAATRLGPPVPRPGAVIAVGANYGAHLAEFGESTAPTKPVLFPKPGTSVTGPRDDIVVPRETAMLDYECELGIVIGGHHGERHARHDDRPDQRAQGRAHVEPDRGRRDAHGGGPARRVLALLRRRGRGARLPHGLAHADAVSSPASKRRRLASRYSWWRSAQLINPATSIDSVFPTSVSV